MKYFMPDWADRVDPNFDFQADAFTSGRDVSADVYAHELFTAPPYDGILLSRAVVEKSKANWEILQSEGARRYLRLPEGLELFGDCGAFSYVDEDEPRYQTDDVLEYYSAIGVDYGASVDHLVVETLHTIETIEPEQEGEREVKQQPATRVMSEEERKRRVQLTLSNAEEFLRLHRTHRHTFTPVGVAQGWTPETYAESVAELVRMGYRYIGLGGLARSTRSQILCVLNAVKRRLEESPGVSLRDVSLHLFGVAKADLLDQLSGYGVASIDSASHLRKAWLRSGQNYLAVNGEWYTAIRIPQSDHPKLKEFISQNGHRPEEVRAKEQYCLEMLQRYNDSGLAAKQLEDLLDTIVDYDMYLLRIGDDGQRLRNKDTTREKYRRTLLQRPWEQCPCEVCRQLGIHVVIFRGTNRNKRRGFHNTWMFYRFVKATRGET